MIMSPRNQYLFVIFIGVAIGVGLCALDWYLTGH